ncbi:AmmeMemoRadiSam system protein B [Sulfuritalea sp.]|uniref:AmmeMemoRadiSam system protein B n=1 Tax=Sulfuritalea sp. TaxID=2480090 RepID=UPI00286E9E0F|nr:AmmeMemoRadiSam system protein B [Sulfuritalea sp.]
MTTATRPPAVAGMFYPGDPASLRDDLATCLAVAPAPTLEAAPPGLLKAIIVPHAGYIYSGGTAGQAYALLAPLAGRIRRVVLLGPCHRVAVRGLAAPTVTAFATPLGNIALDRAALDGLADLPQIVASDAAHAQEHSLEVQLPFLQTVLGEFQLVPLAVGQTGAREVAQVLERLWGGPETLIVISSDLSHFHGYAEAQKIDQATAEHILALDQLSSFEQACGALPINGLLALAKQRGLRIERVAQCNSGDTAGDKSRVVGYASFALYEAPQEAAADPGPALLVRARNAIASHFKQATRAEPDHPALALPGATFVTLTQNGQLRGCIGSLQAHRPLDQDVRANAVAAAFRDPRFPPLKVEELARTRVEVSLLTAPQPMSFTDEADALRQLRPNIDGIIFIAGEGGKLGRSTFLPQVWEQLPEPRMFMAHLKQKAGLPADYWSAEVQLQRYEVQKWKEAPIP